MSNCYMWFLSRIDHISPQEETWLSTALCKVRDAFINGETEEEGNFDFEFVDVSYEKNNPPPGNRSLIFKSDEGGDPWHVGKFVQAFLKEFRPDDSFFLTYAYFSDKPRYNDSGGGAIYVTAKTLKLQDAGDFAKECEKELNKKAKAKKR